MNEETWPDPESVAVRAAHVVGAAARAAVARRGRFLLATSGGTTPWLMMRAVAGEDIPWAHGHLFQVDERVAPEGSSERNLTHLTAALLANLATAPAGVHAMPVHAPDLAGAATAYAAELRAVAGDPPVLDLVQLGLGADGHTASLVPLDPVLEVGHADVAMTGTYGGRRRMTLTYPILNRARAILWVVTGGSKGAALARLRRGDRRIPAGRIQRASALILSDSEASDAARIAEQERP